MAEQLGEKTEMPTGKRRSDAREEGKVPTSQDLNSALDLCAAFALVMVLGAWMVGSLMGLLRTMIGSGSFGPGATLESVGPALRFTGVRTAMVIAPVLGVMFLAVYVTRFLQVGWLVTFKPLQPKLDRLNPVAGMGRLFSKRSVVKSLVNTGKLLVVAIVVILLVRADFAKMAALALLPVRQAYVEIGRLVVEMVLWILAVMVVIGFVDLIYQRWQHTQDLKMTKQEVKDERKMMEGDMDTKARRRRMARSMVLQQLHAAVPTADVVVTNPTHFAVALKYDPENMDAPRVVAKGADYLAFRIREVAGSYNIPIVEKPQLARALFASVEVGRSITPEFYEAVAEILAYVYRIGGRAA